MTQTKVLGQLIESLTYGSIFDREDVLLAPEGSPEYNRLNSMMSTISIGEQEVIHQKYLWMVSNFKTLKVCFKKGNGSFIKMLLNFPYYFLFNYKMETRANRFLSSPEEAILSKTWNTPGVD